MTLCDWPLVWKSPRGKGSTIKPLGGAWCKKNVFGGARKKFQSRVPRKKLVGQFNTHCYRNHVMKRIFTQFCPKKDSSCQNKSVHKNPHHAPQMINGRPLIVRTIIMKMRYSAIKVTSTCIYVYWLWKIQIGGLLPQQNGRIWHTVLTCKNY